MSSSTCHQSYTCFLVCGHYYTITIHCFDCSQPQQGALKNCASVEKPKSKALEPKKCRYKNKKCPSCLGNENFLKVFRHNIVRSDLGVRVLPKKIVERRRARWRHQETSQQQVQEQDDGTTHNNQVLEGGIQATETEYHQGTEADEKKNDDSLIDMYGTVDLYAPTSISNAVGKKH